MYFKSILLFIFRLSAFPFTHCLHVFSKNINWEKNGKMKKWKRKNIEWLKSKQQIALNKFKYINF